MELIKAQVDLIEPAEIEAIVASHNRQPRALIAILQDIQGKYRYLPREALEQAAEILRIPMTQIYGVATFYKAFHLKPRGRHTIKVCMGTACHVSGAPLLLERMAQELKVEPGGTTADRKFSLEEVRCVGCCGLAPVVVVDEEFHGKLRHDRVRRLLRSYA